MNMTGLNLQQSAWLLETHKIVQKMPIDEAIETSQNLLVQLTEYYERFRCYYCGTCNYNFDKNGFCHMVSRISIHTTPPAAACKKCVGKIKKK